jgi:hypothetical protein
MDKEDIHLLGSIANSKKNPAEAGFDRSEY